MPKDHAPETLAVTIGQHAEAGPGGPSKDFHGALVPEGAALTLKGVVLAVADGISPSAMGGVAAEMAVKSLLTDYPATPDGWTARVAATRVIAAANAWLHGQTRHAPHPEAGHVTTLTALILKGRSAHVLHVGDARVSRLSGTSLEPLTQDHRSALGGEGRLARALGLGASVAVDYARVALRAGDVLVMTTDGVHDHLAGADLRAIFAHGDLDAAARGLVAAARANGSTDDATVQIVRVDALPPEGGAFAPELAALPPPPLPRPGDVIDGLVVEARLHASARSHVYRVRDGEGRALALKIPARECAEDPDFRRRFALEEWVARRVASPHVVGWARPPEGRRSLYALAPLIEGETLRARMGRRHTLSQTRAVVAQVAKGLRALHRRQTLHQDLRPENVMVGADGHVTLVDLGSAAVRGVAEAAPGSLGEMPGTFQYTAPEYLSGDAVSWRSDQYALGVVAYEMLTGRLPYGAQVARVRSRRDQSRLVYRPASDDATGVPAWVDAALARAVHPDPLKRFDALSEFVAALETPPPAAAAPRHVPLAERDPLRFWQGLSLLLAVACVVLAARPW